MVKMSDDNQSPVVLIDGGGDVGDRIGEKCLPTEDEELLGISDQNDNPLVSFVESGNGDEEVEQSKGLPLAAADHNEKPLVSIREDGEDEEQFFSAETFMSADTAVDWDMLMSCGNSHAQPARTPWERDSLYVKFDPLVASKRDAADRISFMFKAPKPPGPSMGFDNIAEIKENIRNLSLEEAEQMKRLQTVTSTRELELLKVVDEYVQAKEDLEATEQALQTMVEDRDQAAEDLLEKESRLINGGGDVGDWIGEKCLPTEDEELLGISDQNDNPLVSFVESGNGDEEVEQSKGLPLAAADHNEKPLVSIGEDGEDEEQFFSDETFMSADTAVDWDMSMSCGNSDAQPARTPWERDSLYVKFDPLVASKRDVADRISFMFKAQIPPGPSMEFDNIAEIKENIRKLSLEEAEQMKRLQTVTSTRELELLKVVDEYVQAKEDLEATEQALQTMVEDRDQAAEDLLEMESRFAELLMMYEGVKAFQPKLEQNCEMFQQREVILNQILKKRDEMELMSQQEADRVIEIINKDFEQILKKQTEENMKLKARTRMSEMKTSKLEGEIAQLERENVQLNEFCNELLQK